MIMSEGGNAFCKDLCRCSFYRYVNKMCVWMCMDVYGCVWYVLSDACFDALD